MELAQNQILRNQTQMDNLAKQMEIEIEKTASISNIVVKYAGKRAAIAEHALLAIRWPQIDGLDGN